MLFMEKEMRISKNLGSYGRWFGVWGERFLCYFLKKESKISDIKIWK